MSKSCTLATDLRTTQRLSDPRLQGQSTVRVAVEPLQPAELPRMLSSLRKVNREYPELVTKVEESGEHVLLGSGELMLDCLLHDLRHLYGEVEVRVSDPSVTFSETVKRASSAFGQAATANQKARFSMLASPLAPELGARLERAPNEISGAVLEQEYGWDLVGSQNVWSFGPQSNVFCNVTLGGEIGDSPLGAGLREALVQGYSWAAREGPLCD
jgi:U5 small nuclear ribonucleoprotein component